LIIDEQGYTKNLNDRVVKEEEKTEDKVQILFFKSNFMSIAGPILLKYAQNKVTQFVQNRSAQKLGPKKEGFLII